jgi:CheY-like chemotaxis protein/CRP-like cAMP-binding protein
MAMHKILIIEDNADVRENLAEILELSGYAVETAENGITGVQKTLETEPDLILCDIMMPELDGYGVLKILNNNPKTMNIPFIFLTAKVEKEDFRKGMMLGASDFLTKPCSDVDLLEAIEVRLKKQTGNHFRDKVFDQTQQLKKDFTKEKWNEVFFGKEVRKYPRKSIIFEEGQYPKWLFYIQKGKTKCVVSNEEGKEFITSICSEGDFIGFAPMINETRYRESAYAFDDCELVLLSRDEFFEILYKHHEVVLKLMDMLALRITQQNHKLISLAYNSVRRKVADALITMYEKYEQNGRASFSILRDDLAAMTGTAKETVIRTLSDFKDDGYIKLENNVITIEEVKLLRSIPN